MEYRIIVQIFYDQHEILYLTILKVKLHSVEMPEELEVHSMHIQVHLNKLECSGKVHLFQSFNSNCETRVLNKFNAHRLK